MRHLASIKRFPDTFVLRFISHMNPKGTGSFHMVLECGNKSTLPRAFIRMR